MLRRLLSLSTVALLLWQSFVYAQVQSQPHTRVKKAHPQEQIAPRVVLTTSLGEIEIELNSGKAPISVKNFIDYVQSGAYKETIFHRVIPGFMIQGGGFNKKMEQKNSNPAIKNEADNGLHNLRGTLAMARTGEINSATNQFFINLVDNSALDHSSANFGYAVFGKVIKGMEVVDKIAAVKTTTQGPYENVPVKPVVILSAKVVQL